MQLELTHLSRAPQNLVTIDRPMMITLLLHTLSKAKPCILITKLADFSEAPSHLPRIPHFILCLYLPHLVFELKYDSCSLVCFVFVPVMIPYVTHSERPVPMRAGGS